MLSQYETRILEVFRMRLFSWLSISEINKALKKGTYKSTYFSVLNLRKQGILLAEKRGNTVFCSINLGSMQAIRSLSIVEGGLAEKARIPNMGEICSAIKIKYYTLIITGSYAKGSQKPGSDMDLVVITGNNEDTKGVLNTMINKSRTMVPEVHPYVFKEKEFMQMLLDNEPNYGKETYKNRLIFFGAEQFYLIIKEASKHGFNDKDL
ncbi:MAG: nucleotidyltransferase domain-containing protein [Nanoarchaeota archaeon]|nr:nucleotidyltransferase domain-containing protein [Nanoarchaeota archaeon]